MKNIKIIGAASGLGAQDHGCEDGPDALRAAGLLASLHGAGLAAVWGETLHSLPGVNPSQAVAGLCARLAQQVFDALRAGEFPVVAGGDHSCAVGTWSGVRRALGQERPGLIWIDAHMDSHTPQTSPSGALHGMPLACLLGHGLPSLTAIGGAPPQLLPQHVCLIGVRSFEAAEAALLERLQVRVFHMAEIRRRGIEAVFAEALQIVQHGTAGFGISIDLDALDPREEPGVGSPASDGVLGIELLRAFKLARRHPALLGVELMEYNPHRDRDQVTAQMAIDLLGCILARE